MLEIDFNNQTNMHILAFAAFCAKLLLSFTRGARNISYASANDCDFQIQKFLEDIGYVREIGAKPPNVTSTRIRRNLELTLTQEEVW